jgi:UDP-glucose 4-epimerase
MTGRSWLIVGGAGFVGSHFTDRLLEAAMTERVTLYDNFSSGQAWHYADHAADSRLSVARADVRDLERLTDAARGHDVIIHLASNPDIARAVTEPAVDFDEGTLLTHHVCEAARVAGVPTILYASGSGVYGEIGTIEADEDLGPLMPISTYGASKLAGEALICSYGHMFGIRGRAFRLGNVVGRRQTHGVGFDFVRRLLEDPHRLHILGNGNQSKSYVHVSDVVSAVLTAAHASDKPYDVFNVATGDYITVNEIADLAAQCLGIEPATMHRDYSGGDRGWSGDVPVVRLNTERIRATGWRNRFTSAEALVTSMNAMMSDLKAGRA